MNASLNRVVLEVMAEISAFGLEELQCSTTIKDDLGVDSVTFLLAVVQLQQRLNVDFTSGNRAIAQIRTIGELSDFCVELSDKGAGR